MVKKHYPQDTGALAGALAEYALVLLINPSWPKLSLLHIGFQYTIS